MLKIVLIKIFLENLKVGPVYKRNQEIEIIEITSGDHLGGKLDELGTKFQVAQVDDPVDVVGMRLDDVIKLIKGPKGTQVLTIKRSMVPLCCSYYQRCDRARRSFC